MTQDKIKALNDIGFVWVARHYDGDENDDEDAKKASQDLGNLKEEGSIEKKAATDTGISGEVVVEKKGKDVAGTKTCSL